MHGELKQSGAKDTSSFSKRFQHSIIKLTFIYVIIVAAILSISSATLGSVFSTKLQRRFHRPVIVTDTLIISDDYPSPDDVQADLVNLLVLVNGFLLVIAGGLSYKLAEWTLQPLKKMYEKEQKFLSDASHELRTPLSILKSEFENELSEKNISQKQAARASSNLEEVDRMTIIVSNLLTLSRLTESGLEEKIESTELNLSELVRNTHNRLEHVAEKQHVTINTALPSLDVRIKSNAHLVEAILINSIKNAILYNKQNGTVTITLYSEPKESHIVIADTGIGMSKEDTERIFDRFYRVDKSRSRQTGGSGLGLSIVKSAVEKLNGKIEIESTENIGTTIHIFLPNTL